MIHPLKSEAPISFVPCFGYIIVMHSIPWGLQHDQQLRHFPHILVFGDIVLQGAPDWHMQVSFKSRLQEG